MDGENDFHDPGNYRKLLKFYEDRDIQIIQTSASLNSSLLKFVIRRHKGGGCVPPLNNAKVRYHVL